MAVLGRKIRNFMKNKFHRNTRHGGGAGVPKGHVIVYVGEEEKEYCVSSKCWDAMQLLRESHEQNLRCLPDVSPHEFEIHLNRAKLLVKQKVFNLFTFTAASTTHLTL